MCIYLCIDSKYLFNWIKNLPTINTVESFDFVMAQILWNSWVPLVYELTMYEVKSK